MTPNRFDDPADRSPGMHGLSPSHGDICREDRRVDRQIANQRATVAAMRRRR
jgi:hypothetical protein